MLNAVIEFFRYRKKLTFYECWECGQFWRALYKDSKVDDSSYWEYIPYQDLAVLRWNKHIEKTGETCPECLKKIEHGITPEWINIAE